MPVLTKLRAVGIASVVALSTVVAIVPANALVDPNTVNIIRGSIATATISADEAGLATGPAAPVVDGVITILGIAAAVTADWWVPLVGSSIANLFDSSKQSHSGPAIATPTPSTQPAPPAGFPPAYASPIFGAATPYYGGTTSGTKDQITFQFVTDRTWPYNPSGSFKIAFDASLSCQKTDGTVENTINHDYVSMGTESSTGALAPVALDSASLLVKCATTGSVALHATALPTGVLPAGLVNGNNLWSLNQVVDWVNPTPPTSGAATATKVVTSTTTCKNDSDGSTYNIAKNYDPNQGGFYIPACGSGAHAIASTLSGAHAPGDTSTPNVWQWTPNADPNYPLCDPTKAGPLCVLSVKVDGVSCLPGAAACVQWTNLLTTAPSRVECDWGTYVLPLSDCDVLERAFGPSGAPATKSNTDGDPATWDGTDPSASPSASPSPSTDPSASPSASPTAGVPGVAPGIGSNADPFPDGSHPATNPAPGAGVDVQNCAPNFASWNPIDWVFTPVLCVMKDAFIPKTNLQTTITGIQTKLETKPPVSWLILPPSFGSPAGASCPAWIVHVGSYSANVVCGNAFTDAVVGSRSWIYGMLLVGMIWPLVRSVWYAAIPILRVTPSSGGK